MNFNYMGMPQCNPQNLAISHAGGPDCVTTVGAVFPGFYAWHPGYRTNTNTAFGEDVMRGYKQTAFFASADFDIIPKVLTITAGARHYKYDEFEHGSEYYSATSTVLNVPNGTCTHCGFGMNLNKSEEGWKPRYNVTWHITPDVMTYFTHSEGFRPGGFNRTKTEPGWQPGTLKGVAPYTSGNNQFLKPVGYESDTLINNEIGFKSEWLEHRVQVNLSAYQMDWKNVQLPLFDPVHLGNTTFDINGPTYRIKGIELQLVARLFEGFTIQGSSAWNSSEQTNAPCLPSNNPAGVEPDAAGRVHHPGQGSAVHQPVRRARHAGAVLAGHHVQPAGALRLVDAGRLQRLRLGRCQPHRIAEQPAAELPGRQRSGAEPADHDAAAVRDPGVHDLRRGHRRAKDNWTASITAQNLSNSDAVSNISSGQFIKSEVPIRPRVINFGIGVQVLA